MSLSGRQRPMFVVRRSAASPGRGSGGFLWQERADNAALRQCLHDCAQIKDDTRIVGDQHGEIALLSDGIALALGMRRSGAKHGGTATYPHDRTPTNVEQSRSTRPAGSATASRTGRVSRGRARPRLLPCPRGSRHECPLGAPTLSDAERRHARFAYTLPRGAVYPGY